MTPEDIEIARLHEQVARLIQERDTAREQLTSARNHIANLRECWDTSCTHVFEACVMMGVDPDETPADTWTLRTEVQRLVDRAKLYELRCQRYEERALASNDRCEAHDLPMPCGECKAFPGSAKGQVDHG